MKAGRVYERILRADKPDKKKTYTAHRDVGAALEQLKNAGNECFRRKDYHGALRRGTTRRSAVLTGARRRGLNIGTLLPLLNNRAACHLELADAMSGYGEERVHAYKRASYDAEDAAKLSRMMGGNAKALFRLGRATLGVQSLRSRLVDAAEARGQTDAAEALRLRKVAAKEVDVSIMHLKSALQLQEGNRSISDKLDEAERLQAALERRGAPPPSKAPTPVVRPEKFAASVVFTPGDSWMSNKVALPLPVPKRVGGNAMLPMYLTKQKNDRTGASWLSGSSTRITSARANSTRAARRPTARTRSTASPLTNPTEPSRHPPRLTRTSSHRMSSS